MGSTPDPENVLEAANVYDELEVHEGFRVLEEVEAGLVDEKPFRSHGKTSEVEGRDPGFGFVGVQHDVAGPR